MMVRTLAALSAVCAACASAQATPLNLNLLAYPEISATQIDVSYNAGTFALIASGFSIAYEDDGLSSTPARQIFGGTFNITANVSHAGVASGGTLTITGAIPSLSIGNTTLLSGTLQGFGFTTSGAGRIEFLFGSLGGALASAYTARAPQAGVILNNIANFPYNFNTSWNNLVNGQAGTGSAVSDTGVLPGPGAAGLLALAGLAVRRRR